MHVSDEINVSTQKCNCKYSKYIYAYRNENKQGKLHYQAKIEISMYDWL